MKIPTVSILVPTFNCARYLPILCASIQSQTFDDFEALLWDDGSSDNTDEVLAPFLRDKRFRLLHAAKNQGFARSWRELLLEARGEFWCSPGADDVLFPNFLQRRLERLGSDPHAALIHGPPIHIDEQGHELKHSIPPVRPPAVQEGSDALMALLEHNYINQPSVVVRMETTRRVLSLWREDWKYAGDWHLWLLHAATEQRFLYDSQPAHHYRIHARSLTHAPELKAVRRAEDRLVPLVACARGAAISRSGRVAWQRWRRALHTLWLRRAWVLRRDLPEISKLLRVGTQAFREDESCAAAPLVWQIVRLAPEIIWFSLLESAARRGKSFQPVGLAQVKHPLFATPDGREG